MARRGRRPGTSDTRERILAEARRAFAELGYDRATIRHIAEAAAVDPALVHHYFGTKEALFATAVDVPFAPLEGLDSVLADGADDAGVRLAALFFAVWEDDERRAALLGQLRRGLTEGRMPPLFRAFLERTVVPRLTRHMKGPDAALHAELAAAHLVGVAIIRYVVEIEPVASQPIDDLAAMVGARIQPYLDGTPPR